MQIQITVRYYCIHTRLAKILKIVLSNVWFNVEKLIYKRWEYKLIELFLKT